MNPWAPGGTPAEGGKAWKVGDDEIGYAIVKADTRTAARQRAPSAWSFDFETWGHLRAVRMPQYDHLSEDDAYRQWDADMTALYGEDWGEA